MTDAGSFATVANLRCLLVPRRYKQFLTDHSRKVSEAFTQYRVRYRGRGSCQLRARRARGLPGPARLNGVTRSGRRHARSFELMTFFDFVLYVLRKGQLNRHAQGMYFCLIRRQGGLQDSFRGDNWTNKNNNKGVGTPRVHSVIVLTSPDYHLPGPVGRGPRRSPEGHDWLRLVRARQIR